MGKQHEHLDSTVQHQSTGAPSLPASTSRSTLARLKRAVPMAIVDTQTMPVQHHMSPQLGMKHPVACVGLLYCAASNRTFRIPDVPATSSVGHIKQWYSKNVGDGADLRALVVVHNNLVLEDTVLVWQLAQGQGQFAVTVAENKSPRSMLSLFVESTLPIPAIPLCISSDSTVLYVKQKLFEMLNMPMSLASSSHTTLLMPPSTTPLQNCCTLADCGVRNNMCLSLAFQPEAVQPTAPSPFQQQPQYARIQEIWADNVQAPTKPQDVPIQPVPKNQATAATHALRQTLTPTSKCGLTITPKCMVLRASTPAILTVGLNPFVVDGASALVRPLEAAANSRRTSCNTSQPTSALRCVVMALHANLVVTAGSRITMMSAASPATHFQTTSQRCTSSNATRIVRQTLPKTARDIKRYHVPWISANKSSASKGESLSCN